MLTVGHPGIRVAFVFIAALNRTVSDYKRVIVTPLIDNHKLVFFLNFSFTRPTNFP